MGLSKAFATGVSGLYSHQTAMDNIGNNLANINTVGYKKGVYQFSTVLEQTLQSGMAASDSRGSVNPVSLGGGTQTASINKVFTQGSLESTGSANDMAIYGNGFFVVNTGSGYAYTRDGSFYINEDGYLMGGDGYYVQGTMAVRNSDGSISIPQDSKLENLVVPIGSTGGMAKTSEVSFSGNLNSTQSVSSGLNLYGTNAPTVDNLQSWMSSNINSNDTTWSCLEEKSFVTIDASGLDSVSAVYHVMNADGAVITVEEAGLGTSPASVADVEAAGFVPMVEEIKTINGGNVQTSQSMGIKVPDYVNFNAADLPDGTPYNGPDGKTYGVKNSSTYPMWFYESTGGSLDEAASWTDAEIAADFQGYMEAVWPDGFNGESGYWPGNLPVKGETYPASLTTPLEQVYVYEGNKWTQLFPNIQDGDEVSISFDKGEGSITATFVYNRPGDQQAIGNQQKLDYEKSYTLEHFLTFLAGDVNSAGTACAGITPDMFDSEKSYNDALANYALAKSDSNTSTNGGAMGLIDVAAQISSANGGADAYDAPMETAGAFTREGMTQAGYLRWNGTEYEEVKADSFNVSLVSNLGGDNALSNISISYNNSTNKTVFSSESEYSSEKGGSATASVTFYDSLGNPRTATVRLSLVSEDSKSSTWRWYADCEDDTDFPWQVDPDTGEITTSLNAGTGLFQFDSDGNFIAGSDFSETGGIVINLANQGVDDTIHVPIQNGLNSKEKQNLDFSSLTFTATKNSLSLSEQNGAPPGSLESYTVGADGTIMGVYSTGVTAPLGKLVIATVANMNGLTAGSGNLYYTTPASGEAMYGYAELGGRGSICQYQLEASNVDMSEEFTKLISIERGYQANSRVITTADEMLQELLNMKR